MVETRHLDEPSPIEVTYSPQAAHRLLPVEVVDRGELVFRSSSLARRQRVGFHQLVLCTEGHGTHWIDFEEITMSPGKLLRIRPGQVQRFVPEPTFEAAMVVWPVESHPADLAPRPWYPGSATPTHWQVNTQVRARIERRIDDLRVEQELFDGSSPRIALMLVQLQALLLQLAIDVESSSDDESLLPRPYLDLRRTIEQRMPRRSSVAELAQELGYSTRTLDRACQRVTGQTAKQVVDGRVGFEIRRLLTYTSRPVAGIGADFGFNDPSNFSKFVRRHLGQLPSEIRARGTQ